MSESFSVWVCKSDPPYAKKLQPAGWGQAVLWELSKAWQILAYAENLEWSLHKFVLLFDEPCAHSHLDFCLRETHWGFCYVHGGAAAFEDLGACRVCGVEAGLHEGESVFAERVVAVHADHEYHLYYEKMWMGIFYYELSYKYLTQQKFMQHIKTRCYEHIYGLGYSVTNWAIYITQPQKIYVACIENRCYKHVYG